MVQPSLTAEVSGPPMEDEREVLTKGIEAVGSAVATKSVFLKSFPFHLSNAGHRTVSVVVIVVVVVVGWSRFS